MSLPLLLPRLLPSKSAAIYIGVSESKLRLLNIPRKELDGKRLYDRLDLDAYADGLSYEGEARGNSCDGRFGVKG